MVIAPDLLSERPVQRVLVHSEKIDGALHVIVTDPNGRSFDCTALLPDGMHFQHGQHFSYATLGLTEDGEGGGGFVEMPTILSAPGDILSLLHEIGHARLHSPDPLCFIQSIILDAIRDIERCLSGKVFVDSSASMVHLRDPLTGRLRTKVAIPALRLPSALYRSYAQRAAVGEREAWEWAFATGEQLLREGRCDVFADFPDGIVGARAFATRCLETYDVGLVARYGMVSTEVLPYSGQQISAILS